MPSWPVHFAIAKEVNKKLKLDKDLFYYGNILPDVGYGFNINRDDIHYYGIPFDFCPKEEQINLNRFIKDYKKFLDNPLVLGILFTFVNR